MRKWIGIWDWWANKAFATVIQFLDPHLHFLFLSLLLLYFALLGFNFTVSLSLPLPSFYDPLMFSFSQNYCLPLLSSPLCHVLLSCLSFSLPLLGVVFVVTVFFPFYILLPMSGFCLVFPPFLVDKMSHHSNWFRSGFPTISFPPKDAGEIILYMLREIRAR